jgi:hypothetical protein
MAPRNHGIAGAKSANTKDLSMRWVASLILSLISIGCETEPTSAPQDWQSPQLTPSRFRYKTQPAPVARTNMVAQPQTNVLPTPPHDDSTLDPSFAESNPNASRRYHPSTRPSTNLPGGHVLKQWKNYRQQGLIDERP